MSFLSKIVQTRKNLVRHALILALFFFGIACGGADTQDPPAGTATGEAGLSEVELEQGLGPIRNLELGAIDTALVAQGEGVFTIKCSACHKMAERYVGPPLGDVTSRRAPEFIMNMILNPDEMVKRHPEGQALLAQFMTPMPNQNLTEEEARAVLEYLRQVQAGQ